MSLAKLSIEKIFLPWVSKLVELGRFPEVKKPVPSISFPEASWTDAVALKGQLGVVVGVGVAVGAAPLPKVRV